MSAPSPAGGRGPSATGAPAEDGVASGVREVLLAGALAGSDPAALADDTPLVSAGVLDSVRTVQLVGDLEDRFGVAFEAYEMSVEHLDTVAAIAATIRGKLHGR